MNPTYSPANPGDFVVIIGLIAAAIPGFLASWKRPGMALSAIFMSFCSIVFAVNGNKFTADLVFAVLWAGAMLLAAISRAVERIEGVRLRLDAPVSIRIAPDDADAPQASAARVPPPSKTAPISPPRGG